MRAAKAAITAYILQLSAFLTQRYEEIGSSGNSTDLFGKIAFGFDSLD